MPYGRKILTEEKQRRKNMGGRGHQPNCDCRFCKKGKEEMKTANDDSVKHIRNWSRGKCEDELASIRYQILSRVSQLSKYWTGLVELNRRKEDVQTRLEELGVDIRNQ